MFNINQIITQLNYNELLNNKIIMNFMIDELSYIQYPKKMTDTRSLFEKFINTIVMTIIQGNSVHINQLYYQIFKQYYKNQIPKEYLLDIWTETLNISTMIKNIKFNQYMTSPDYDGTYNICNDDNLLEIVTTESYTQIFKQTMLRLLGGVCLCKYNNINIKYIGIYATLQKIAIWYDVSIWDHTKFLNKIIDETISLHEDIRMNVYINPENWTELGYHCFSDTKYHMNKPFQIFCPKNTSDENITKQVYIQIRNDITLSDIQNLEIIKNNIIIGNKIQSKGLIIYGGKYNSYRDDLKRMISNVNMLLPEINLSCPLIIKTSTGGDMELCGSYESMKLVYKKLKKDKRIGICIDVSNVYASGTDPFKYLKTWDEEFPKSIKLVHFNDSSMYRGTCLKHSTSLGTGYVGTRKLNDIYIYCLNKNIPMIVVD